MRYLCLRTFRYPLLFDALCEIVSSGRRDVQALQDAALLPATTFFCETVRPPPQREEWFACAKAKLEGCDLVFLDPDNGLEPEHPPSRSRAGKYVTLAELESLKRPGRSILLYHHQARRKCGHFAEMADLAERLRKGAGFSTIDALRARPYAPRLFFILNGSSEIRARAEGLAKRWNGHLTWHPHGAPVEVS